MTTVAESAPSTTDVDAPSGDDHDHHHGSGRGFGPWVLDRIQRIEVEGDRRQLYLDRKSDMVPEVGW